MVTVVRRWEEGTTEILSLSLSMVVVVVVVHEYYYHRYYFYYFVEEVDDIVVPIRGSSWQSLL